MKPLKEYLFLNPEVFNKVSNLELRARKIVEGYLNGIHRSPFLGNSVEFAGHREYVPGDEIKRLDWKIWGRSDKLFVKQYEEETNLACHIILDTSNSMGYSGINSEGISKFQYACTIAAVLMLLMNKQGDGVGLTAFDNKIISNINSSSSPSHLQHLFFELSKLSPNSQTDLNTPMHFLAESFRKKGVIVLISDLFVKIENFISALKHFRYCGHEVIIFQVMHDDELNFSFNENLLFKGMESSDIIQSDALSLRNSYLKVVKEHNEKIKKVCSTYDYDNILISTNDSLGAVLSSYLNFRQRIRSLR